MKDDVSISGPVRIESDSKARVAYDLMIKIDTYNQVKSEQKDEKYWLTLYRRCSKTVDGIAEA